MKEILEQIQRSEDTPVRNCRIGVNIQCIPIEIREAIKSGKYKLIRNASYRQQHPDATGCNNYALEDVKIIYDEAGMPLITICPTQIQNKFWILH